MPSLFEDAPSNSSIIVGNCKRCASNQDSKSAAAAITALQERLDHVSSERDKLQKEREKFAFNERSLQGEAE